MRDRVRNNSGADTEGAERRMACRSAAARGMTCEGAAGRGTEHARWRSGRGGVRAATEHARWRNFTILYARADKIRLSGKIRLFCTLGQGFRLVFSTLEANLAKNSVPTVHFSVISPESPTFRAQGGCGQFPGPLTRRSPGSCGTRSGSSSPGTP